MTLQMQAPSTWLHAVVTGITANNYTLDENQQLSADPVDVPVLLAYGFYPVGKGAAPLEALSDVDITSPADSDVLTWNSTEKKWENKAGGGGGAAIQPETGSSGIKISAFPNPAVTGMAPTALLTGLDANGANANYTQAQILRGQDALVSSNTSGSGLYIKGGAGDGSGYGAIANIYGGAGGSTGNGGRSAINGGNGGATAGNGGGAFLIGGNAYSGNGGQAVIVAGHSAANGNGGSVVINSGYANGASYKTGDIHLYIASGRTGASAGNIIIQDLPTVDPSRPGALYVDPVTHIVHWK